VHRKSRRYLTLNVYIVREIAFSFFVAFLFFFFIFFVNNLLLLIQKENVLAKNIPIPEILLIVIFRLPIVILFAFPFGTLVGSLMAVARLSSDNEVLAMRASGVSTYRLFLPFLIIGLLLSLLSYYSNDYLLPAGSLEQKKLGQRIFLAHPQLQLEAYSVKPVENQKLLIMTGAVDDNYIYDIVIFDKDAQLDRRIITAKRARVAKNMEQDAVITLELEEVFSHVMDAQDHEKFEYSYAASMEYNLLIKPFSVNVSLGPMEKTAVDIWKIIEQKQTEYDGQLRSLAFQVQSQLYTLREEIRLSSESDSVLPGVLGRERSKMENIYANYLSLKDRTIKNAELQRYVLEFHRKFAFPFSCLVFVIFTFPIGLMARRSGRIFGFGIGLLASIIYWGLLLFGHELGFNQGYPPLIAMWLPNGVVLAAGIVLNILRLKR
jgi:lipopolysaccharide export system permease protein